MDMTSDVPVACRLRSIALSGRSGAGKTTVAEWLSQAYGYNHRRSGALCRQICLDLFDDDSKEMLNAVTAAMRSLRSDVWISAALRALPGDELVVFDSMRFAGDYERLRNAGFALWRVVAPLDRRVERLRVRGQGFDPDVDDVAGPEVELDDHSFDLVIDNSSDDVGALWVQVQEGLRLMAEGDAAADR
jgi:cytidylate kinase